MKKEISKGIYLGAVLLFSVLLVFTLIVWREQERGGSCSKERQFDDRIIAVHSTSEKAPALVNQEEPPIKTDQSHADSENYFCRVISPTNLPTDYLVIVGIGGVFIALSSLNAIRRQTDIFDRSAAAAQTAAEAALKTIQLTINAERALVEINLVAPTTYIDEQTGEEFLGGRIKDTFRYGISITNHGRTVARIISYAVSRTCAPKNVSPQQFDRHFQTTEHALVGADKSHVLGHVDIDRLFTDIEWPSIQDEIANAMFRIDVQYEDVLKNSSERCHETSATFRYDTRIEAARRLPEHNAYT